MLTPETGLPCESATRTDGAVGSAVATGPVWVSPAFFARLAAAAAVPVALNVTGLPLKPVALAVSVLVPAVECRGSTMSPRRFPNYLTRRRRAARRHKRSCPTRRWRRVTVTPDTGLLSASLTSTAGAVPTLAPTVAL